MEVGDLDLDLITPQRKSTAHWIPGIFPLVPLASTVQKLDLPPLPAGPKGDGWMDESGL